MMFLRLSPKSSLVSTGPHMSLVSDSIPYAAFVPSSMLKAQYFRGYSVRGFLLFKVGVCVCVSVRRDNFHRLSILLECWSFNRIQRVITALCTTHVIVTAEASTATVFFSFLFFLKLRMDFSIFKRQSFAQDGSHRFRVL